MTNTRRTPATLIVIGFTASLLLVLSFTPTHQMLWRVSAQDPTSAPAPTPDLELERLKREAALSDERAKKAENEKRLAEAQKAELEARFPKASTSPLSGTTTVEGAVIESQIVSYRLLRTVATEIVDNISPHFPRNEKLAVFNERDVNTILSFRVAQAQVSLIQQDYKKLMPGSAIKIPPVFTPTPCVTPKPSPEPDVLAPPPPEIAKTSSVPAFISPLRLVESFLGGFIDMTALLRTNVEIKGQTFVIDEGPLVAEVFRAAHDPQSTTKKIKGALYYPYVFPLDVDKRGSTFLAYLEVAHQLRVEAETLLGDVVITNSKLAEKNDEVEQLKGVIGRALPKKTVAAVLVASNVIKASCRRYTEDVELIKSMTDFEKQSKKMRDLIDQVHQKCTRMDPDRMEILLGLRDQLVQLEKDLNDAKSNLADAIDDQTKLAKQLADLKVKLDLGDVDNPPDPDKVKARVEFAIARLKAINAMFDGLVAALIQSDGSGPNLLTSYIRMERLTDVLGPCDLWLQLKVINAGGNNRIKSNLLWDIFRGGSSLTHSGGVIAQYNLYNYRGESVNSGVVSKYSGYVNAKKIK